MKLILENWRGYKETTEVEALMLEVCSLSEEIINYCYLIKEGTLLDEGFVKDAAKWLGDKWKQLSTKADQLFQKSKQAVAALGRLPSKAKEAYLGAMTKLQVSLMQFLPTKEKAAFEDVIKSYSEALWYEAQDHLGEKAWQDKIEDAVREGLEEVMRGIQVPSNRAEQKKVLEQQSKEITRMVQEKVLNHPELKKVKEILKDDIDPEVVEQKFIEELGKRGLSLRAISGFAVGGSFMFTFGVIDNLGLLVGMAAVEDSLIQMGYDSQMAGMLGNTLSDALGVMLGAAVAGFLLKRFGVKGEGIFSQQLIMVVAGCLLPVAVKALWMWFAAHGFLPPE